MKKLVVIIALAALACLPATADTIRLVGTGSNTQGGVITAPYFLSVNGGTNISAICVDFDHHVTIGETWSGNISSMAGDLSNTRLGASGFTTYREEAWLYSEFLSGAGPSGDINFAIWALTSANAMASSGWDAGAQHWLNLAKTTDLANFSTLNFKIITPADLTGSGAQEYVVATPEPGGLILLGSGLLGFSGLMRKRMAVKL